MCMKGAMPVLPEVKAALEPPHPTFPTVSFTPSADSVATLNPSFSNSFFENNSIHVSNYEEGIDLSVDLQVHNLEEEVAVQTKISDLKDTYDKPEATPIEPGEVQILPRPQKNELEGIQEEKLVKKNPKWVDMLGVADRELEESSGRRTRSKYKA